MVGREGGSFSPTEVVPVRRDLLAKEGPPAGGDRTGGAGSGSGSRSSRWDGSWR